MSDKKLTKVQKEILTTLRDNPEARIKKEYNGVYRLYVGDKEQRTIIWDTYLFLKIWLKQEPKGDKYSRTLYSFREGTEISDTWRTQEIERQQVEAQQKRDEDTRIKEEAYQALVRRLRNVFAAIERGEIDNQAVEYDSRLRFDYGGKWYNLSEE